MNSPAALNNDWIPVCAINDILPDTGVAAKLDQQQIAIFRIGHDQVFAVGNHDPFSGANVISRGITGDINGELVVASPVYKQHFRLRDGVCVEDPEVSIGAWPVRLFDGVVIVCRNQRSRAA